MNAAGNTASEATSELSVRLGVARALARIARNATSGATLGARLDAIAADVAAAIPCSSMSAALLGAANHCPRDGLLWARGVAIELAWPRVEVFFRKEPLARGATSVVGANGHSRQSGPSRAEQVQHEGVHVLGVCCPALSGRRFAFTLHREPSERRFTADDEVILLEIADDLCRAAADAAPGTERAQAPGCPVAELSDSLTRREREVFELVLKGLGNVDVARQLGVKLVTVNFHLSRIFGKCGVRDCRELLARVLDRARARAASGRAE